MPTLTVILCAHNPRRDHFEETLASLRQQTYPLTDWELVVIDNASHPPIPTNCAASWHPAFRVICESRLGLTHARLRGIAETRTSLIVFVDTDNVLASDFLEGVVSISKEYPKLGVWSGNILLDFDYPPPSWTERYWPFLAYRTVQVDQVASGLGISEPMPIGAGLCMRRDAAQSYVSKIKANPLRLELDRKGDLLSSGGDTDLVLTVCESGWQRGVFQRLRLRHLIPSSRLTEDYLARLVGGIAYSNLLLEFIHEPHRPPPAINLWWWIKYRLKLMTKFGRRRRFFKSYKFAHRLARQAYEHRKELIHENVQA